MKQYHREREEFALQWGHDLVVMESRVCMALGYEGKMLQWGHDLVVMERALGVRVWTMPRVASMGP